MEPLDVFGVKVLEKEAVGLDDESGVRLVHYFFDEVRAKERFTPIEIDDRVLVMAEEFDQIVDGIVDVQRFDVAGAATVKALQITAVAHNKVVMHFIPAKISRDCLNRNARIEVQNGLLFLTLHL